MPDLELPAPPEPGAFPIPPVIERPLDPEAGDRVFVRRFELRGAQGHPEQGVVLEEIREAIEKLRVEKQGLTEVGDDGFTPGERKEIADFIRKVVNNPDLDMYFDEYQALIDKLRLEKFTREAGMTIGQMQQIANAVTEYYRGAGFILAQAFIPAQEVEEGVVTIEVLEGKLGNVLADGNQRYSDDLLALPFRDLIDAPVTAGGIESAILTVTDYPGVTASGVFQPGQRVGTADLVVKVQDEKPFDATLRADNWGTRFTGRQRLLADFTLNNPTKGGDRFTGSILQQYNPKNDFFFGLEYERPLFFPDWLASVSYQKNAFDLGAELEGTGLRGESKVGELSLRKSFIRSRQKNVSFNLGLSRKTALTKQESTVLARDDLAMARVGLTFDSIDTATRAINLASVEFTQGLDGKFGGMADEEVSTRSPSPSRRGGSGNFASNSFRKATASYSRLQTLTDDQTLLVRVEGQKSNSLLTSVEQFSMGGPSNVRAFPINEFLTDSGLFGSVEWTINAPFFADQMAFENLRWGDVLRVSFFTDFATGWVNDPVGSEEQRVNISGFGGSLQFSLPGQMSARLQAAHPYGNRIPSDGRQTRYWVDFTYNF